MSESLEAWRGEALRLRQAIEDARSQLVATGCPLCTYLDGKVTKACALHLEVERLNLQVNDAKEQEKYWHERADERARELMAANRLNGEWVDFAGTLVQKIHDLQHTGSSPLCQQPTCKAFYEKREPLKRKCDPVTGHHWRGISRQPDGSDRECVKCGEKRTSE